jgi:hypothetical protein
VKGATLLCWIAASCASIPHAAAAIDSFVVPSQWTSAESPDGGNALPFGTAGGNTRCQQIYLDSDVPAGPFTIFGVAFRPDAATEAYEKPLASVDLYVSTPVGGTSVLSTSFAANVGANPTLVRSGPLPIATQATGPAPGPKDFDVVVWFDTPFPYVAGDLLLDVRVNSSEPGNRFLESISTDPDPIGRVCSVGIFGGSVNAATGDADTGGLVTKFLLVPEPRGDVAAAIACAVILLRARKVTATV